MYLPAILLQNYSSDCEATRVNGRVVSSRVESMRFNDRDRANKSSRKRIIAHTVKLCRRSTGFRREDKWRKEEGKEIKSARHSPRYVLARKGKRSWNKISGRPTTFAGKYARLGPFSESVIKKRSGLGADRSR